MFTKKNEKNWKVFGSCIRMLVMLSYVSLPLCLSPCLSLSLLLIISILISIPPSPNSCKIFSNLLMSPLFGVGTGTSWCLIYIGQKGGWS